MCWSTDPPSYRPRRSRQPTDLLRSELHDTETSCLSVCSGPHREPRHASYRTLSHNVNLQLIIECLVVSVFDPQRSATHLSALDDSSWSYITLCPSSQPDNKQHFLRPLTPHLLPSPLLHLSPPATSIMLRTALLRPTSIAARLTAGCRSSTRLRFSGRGLATIADVNLSFNSQSYRVS